jgi:hypothetical protein
MSLVAELVSLALGIGVAYLAITDAAAPIANWPASWRFVVFLFATMVATQVFRNLLGLLTPVLEGSVTATEIVSSLGAALLVVAVVSVWLRVGGTIPPRR